MCRREVRRNKTNREELMKEQEVIDDEKMNCLFLIDSNQSRNQKRHSCHTLTMIVATIEWSNKVDELPTNTKYDEYGNFGTIYTIRHMQSLMKYLVHLSER
jgi:anionic cell wall polymer biosynthesis LytR-Cps2A-Psr (LCP) family protein